VVEGGGLKIENEENVTQFDKNRCKGTEGEAAGEEAEAEAEEGEVDRSRRSCRTTISKKLGNLSVN